MFKRHLEKNRCSMTNPARTEERREETMLWLTLLRREEGQDLTEYALLIALIVIIAIAAIALLGQAISEVLSQVASTLQSAMN